MADRNDRDWAKLARRTLTTVCAVGAVTASFIFLTDLARQNGWPYWAALLLPLCIDALGGMALLQYRTRQDAMAGWVAAGAITASFVGNGLSHLYATGVITPGWVSIALIGGVPAVSLGLCVHLTTRKDTGTWSTQPSIESAVPVSPTRGIQPDGGVASSAPSSTATVTLSAKPKPATTGSANGAAPAAGTAPASKRPKRSDADLVKQVLDNDWSMLSGDVLAHKSHLGVAKGRALRIRSQARSSSGNGKVAAGVGS